MVSRLPAPEFPAGLEWVNVSDAPLMSGLRGRVVLLWFWSYDNVHCWNLLPDLAHLESRYHDGLTVIGVHTPKYPHQRDASVVLKAVNRLQIRHPVANDPQHALWRQFSIEAWPSVVVIDAEGQVVSIIAGEGHRVELDELIGRLLDEAAERDLREYEAAPTASRPEPRESLLFPGKVLATDEFLYIADSGHHRVIECKHDGRIQRQFGSSDPGYWDGRDEQCGFRDPQGLALRDDFLYVADRGNHCIRRIRLRGGDVETVLGTGEQGRVRPHEADPLVTPIGTPTGLAVVAYKLHVSLEASFAQPVGIAAIGMQLLVVDAASSAVRLIRLLDGRVSTLVGSGLYEYGDAPGARDVARLQNPLDITLDPRGIAFIADSYNGKIKALSLKSGAVRALNVDIRMFEPAGLSIAAGALWIANTNVHEIVRIDLASGIGKRVPVGE